MEYAGLLTNKFDNLEKEQIFQYFYILNLAYTTLKVG